MNAKSWNPRPAGNAVQRIGRQKTGHGRGDVNVVYLDVVDIYAGLLEPFSYGTRLIQYGDSTCCGTWGWPVKDSWW